MKYSQDQGQLHGCLREHKTSTEYTYARYQQTKCHISKIAMQLDNTIS
jgi:hypothetical protein